MDGWPFSWRGQEQAAGLGARRLEERGSARPLDLDELVDRCTLVDDELDLLRTKSAAGLGVILKRQVLKVRLPGPGELTPCRVPSRGRYPAE